MKLTILHDYRPDPKWGGAEQNMIALCDEAEKQGHTIAWYGFEKADEGMKFEAPTPDKVDGDILILGSISILDPRWVNDIVERFAGRIVAWCHDAPWCFTRCGSCEGQYQPQHKGCQMGWYWHLYRKASVVLCYSPLHEQRINNVFPGVETEVLPIFCDRASVFYEARHLPTKQDSVIVVGRQSHAKGGLGTMIFAKRNPQYHVDVYGNMPDEIKKQFAEIENVTLHGHVDHELLPELYGAHEYFFHQPEVLDAGPRTLVEARLAGCKLITNNRLGYPTHPVWDCEDERLVKGCKQAMAFTLDTIIERGTINV